MVTKKVAKKRAKVSAARRVAEHTIGFDFTSFKLPEGMNLFKAKEGTKRIDIIPFTAGEGNPFADEGMPYFERTYWVHRGVGPDENSYVCPKKTAGKKCYICEMRAKLSQSSDPDDAELAKALAPKERQLWLVYDRDDKDKGIQLWDCSMHLFGKRLETEIKAQDDGEGLEFFADPEDGFTLRVSFEEVSRGGYSFVEASSIAFKARQSPIPDEILEAAPCVDELLVILPYDELKAVYLQEPADEDDDEKSKSKKKGKPADDDEDEEEEEESDDEEEDDDDEDEEEEEESDDEEEDDEEEDEAPKKKSKSPPPKKGKKPVKEDEDEEEEDEEEEEDDDEEEDEPRPTKKKSPGKDLSTAEDKGIEVDDFVKHKKHGVCEVTKISKDGKKCSLEDNDGEEFDNVLITDVELWAGDDEEDDAKAKKAPPKKGKKKPVDDEEEDEEDEEEEDEEEEDEEEEAPRKKGKVPAKKPRR